MFSPNIGWIAAGVTTDKSFVYCFGQSTRTVVVLDKKDGREVRRFDLVGGSVGNLYGGVALVSGKLYMGINAMVYRFNMSTGQYDGVSFSTMVSIYNMVRFPAACVRRLNGDSFHFHG